MNDKHVKRSRVVHGCCVCRGEIVIGQPLHVQQVWVGHRKFKIRYYDPTCWHEQHFQYGQPLCEECERLAFEKACPGAVPAGAPKL